MASVRWYVITEHTEDSEVSSDIHKVSQWTTQREAIADADRHAARLRSASGFMVELVEHSGGSVYRVTTPKRNYTLKVVRDEHLLNRRVFVQSSLCYRIGYNTKQGHLFIRFKNGQVWKYECPSEIFFQLCSAKSIGQTYNLVVKGKFPGEQV